jgi:hypothetical protein
MKRSLDELLDSFGVSAAWMIEPHDIADGVPDKTLVVVRWWPDIEPQLNKLREELSEFLGRPVDVRDDWDVGLELAPGAFEIFDDRLVARWHDAFDAAANITGGPVPRDRFARPEAADMLASLGATAEQLVEAAHRMPEPPEGWGPELREALDHLDKVGALSRREAARIGAARG